MNHLHLENRGGGMSNLKPKLNNTLLLYLSQKSLSE
jgi:hypothetical protein